MSHFRARTIATARDLSLDERIYLFENTSRLKTAMQQRDHRTIDKYRMDDPDLGMYLCFWEDSTRTKESFRNAGRFMRIQLNDLDVKKSSVEKGESYANTIKTLVGYDNSFFVLRTETEGVCAWLDEKVAKYADRFGLAKPCFISGGDGKHEHPTQEELDEFSFLEQLGGREHMHIALIGDLLHGRTVHSKVDGLKVFKDVKVDLIAPELLQMPKSYVSRMKRNGFQVRIFESLDEYYAQDDKAKVQYFTRLQLERMDPIIKARESELRKAVTFRKDHVDRQREGTKLYHPQPFDKFHPTIPPFVEDTGLNGFDQQSINGYLYRIILLNAVTGNIGDDFEGSALSQDYSRDDFIREIEPTNRQKPQLSEGILPIKDGNVIDHICRGEPIGDIWNHLILLMRVMDTYSEGDMGVHHSKGEPDKFKGLVSLPRYRMFSEDEVVQLAAAAPGCTLNRIVDGRVVSKSRLSMPPYISRLKHTACSNDNCVTYAGLFEGAWPRFVKSGQDYICTYCDTVHSHKEIWGGD